MQGRKLFLLLTLLLAGCNSLPRPREVEASLDAPLTKQQQPHAVAKVSIKF